VKIVEPRECIIPLQRKDQGYHEAIIDSVEQGSLYLYRVDGDKELPDPASRFQPRGVHGPSQIVHRSFLWQDETWCGIPMHEYIIYELHVGTFTQKGTFEAIIPHLDELRVLGITAVELMPIAQFPGSRNWGYDGVYPFAVQDSYGGIRGLKKLVNACHQRGLAVVLDVVYNHLGPEGNYLGEFGPYFTERYHTPWGPALNFDGPYSDEVRRYFIQNALYWVTEFHIDALRLDAVHAILDHSPKLFLEELAEAVHEEALCLNRMVFVIPEGNQNDARLFRPRDRGGYGLDAQWSDDFHHSLWVLLTGEQAGYYEDFGPLNYMVKAYQEGFVYTGEYAPFWKRRRGVPCDDIPAERFVVFAQNHDQVGNRAVGDRLSKVVPLEGLKLVAGVVLLSPFIPLLFMGEEYGETAPFQYFISHLDSSLVEAVRRGRREEFASFQWQGQLPDPQDEATFQRSKLSHGLKKGGHHKILLDFYTELLRLRKSTPALSNLSKDHVEVIGYEDEKVMFVRRWTDCSQVFAVFNFNSRPASVALPLPAGQWRKLLDSAEKRWQGPGTEAPCFIESKGNVDIILKTRALCLFGREE
ncbi:malto-oligosyltrehalose trehalohydrolase, partial [Chloroflexota bacterium]